MRFSVLVILIAVTSGLRVREEPAGAPAKTKTIFEGDASTEEKKVEKKVQKKAEAEVKVDSKKE
jgi:hypothetical protein